MANKKIKLSPDLEFINYVYKNDIKPIKDVIKKAIEKVRYGDY